MPDTAVRQRCEFPLHEISALCVRGSASAPEILAIGDKTFDVAVAELGASGVEAATSRSLFELIPPEDRPEGDGSQWEGLAADRDGRVFVLEESGKVFVLSPDLQTLLQTIHLDVRESEDESVRRFFDDPNAGAEALVLLPEGLLVAKQKEPIMLVHFGRPDSDAGGEEPTFAQDVEFKLSGEPQTVLTALRHWTMQDRDEKDIESLNDLAVDTDGNLHAISSKARRICRLRVADREIEIAESWRLAHAIEASKKRKAEGLAFGAHDEPFVAVDTKDDDDNVFVLETL